MTRFGFHSILPTISWHDLRTNGVLFDMAAWLEVSTVRTLWYRQFLQTGPRSFDWRIVDDNVQKAADRGMLLAPTVHLGNARKGWFGARDTSGVYGPVSNIATSEPPSDLAETWSSKVGYSSSIYYFFFELFLRYPGTFPYIAVGSEPTSEWAWRGTISEYLHVLETVHKARNDSGSDVIVIDGGIASDAWGNHVGREMLLRGVMSDGDVADVVRGYYSTTLHASEFQRLTNAEIVSRLLTDPGIIAKYDQRSEYMNGVITLLGTRAFNFHFYEGTEYLGDLIRYLKWKLRTIRPSGTPDLICHELGVRSQDPLYDEKGEGQAAELRAKLDVCTRRGLSFVSWFGVTGVGHEDGFKAIHDSVGNPYEAAGTYRDIVRTS